MGALAVAATLLWSGCSTPRSPVRTTLVDSAGEQRAIEILPPGASLGPDTARGQPLSLGDLLEALASAKLSWSL